MLVSSVSLLFSSLLLHAPSLDFACRYTEESWEEAVVNVSWARLGREQLDAARALGYDMRTWNEAYVDCGGTLEADRSEA